MGWKLRSLALLVCLYQIVQMVLQGIKDGLDIKDHIKHNHQAHSVTIMCSWLLGLNLFQSLVLMFSSVFAIGFLAETPHTVDVFHVMFAITHYALKAAFWKVLSVAADLLMLMLRKFPQVRNFSQADEGLDSHLPD